MDTINLNTMRLKLQLQCIRHGKSMNINTIALFAAEKLALKQRLKLAFIKMPSISVAIKFFLAV